VRRTAHVTGGGMLKKINLCLFAISVVIWGSSVVFAEVKVGDVAPDFTLTDSLNKEHSLSEYKGKYVVLEWVNFDCPFVIKHYGSQNMQSLQKQYTEKEIIWLSINSSAEGKQGNFSADEINEKIAEREAMPTAYLIDSDGQVGKTYGAKTTPHMYIINPDGYLIYQGAIDDTPSFDPGDIASSENFVKLALSEAMAGQQISNPQTKSYGCSVKY